MQSVGRIDPAIYACVGVMPVTDEVIITEERIDHIKQRHPDSFEKYSGYMAAIVADPDYIIEDSRYATAMVLKQIEENGERFRLALRLATEADNPEYKNSIITFLRIREKEWNRLIRNKRILYKKE